MSLEREQELADGFKEAVAVVAMGLSRWLDGCPMRFTELFPEPGGGSGVKSRRGDDEWERFRESWWEELGMDGSEDESLIPEPKYGE